jgi:hypothetical protein
MTRQHPDLEGLSPPTFQCVQRKVTRFGHWQNEADASGHPVGHRHTTTFQSLTVSMTVARTHTTDYLLMRRSIPPPVRHPAHRHRHVTTFTFPNQGRPDDLEPHS